MIGLSTPPIGGLLFVTSMIAKVPMNQLVREILPFVLMFILGIASSILGILTLGLLFLVLPIYYSLVIAYFGSQLSQQPGFTD